MNLEFEYVHRCWIYAAAEKTPYTVDAYAKQQGVSFDPGTCLLRMVFPNQDAALNCVAGNQDFEILYNVPQFTFVEFLAQEKPVSGKDTMGLSDYVVPAYTSGDAIAFIQQQATSITPLQIVEPGKATGHNQVAIHQGGKFEASKNLKGKTITIRRLPVIYPEVINGLTKPLPSITVHLVFTDRQGRFQLYSINAPEIIPTNQYTTTEVIIQAKVNLDKVSCRAFA